MYRVEYEANQFVVRVYDSHPDNYSSSATIRKYGDVGWMSQIIGKGFYEAAREPGVLKKLMDDVGVKTLEGYLTDVHARAMRMALKRIAEVSIRHRGICGGREMSWVVVKIND